MAGHSKWANIKHKKARVDQKRGQAFTKLIREITVAARVGGGNVEDNPRLRLAVQKALGANMTKEAIDRAIKKGAGGGDEGIIEEIMYEGYGPGGIAFMVESATDNRNRTVAAIRHAFNKHNGNLGADGSVAYLFSRYGQILATDAQQQGEDALLEIAIEAGAEDVRFHNEGLVEVLSTPEDLFAVKDALEAQSGLTIEEAALIMVADRALAADDAVAEKTLRLLDTLEELEDVKSVFINAIIPDRLSVDD